MRVLAIIAIVSFPLITMGQADLHEVRSTFYKANDAKDFKWIINSGSEDDDAVLTAYKGASLSRMAEFVINPFKKLDYFNQGKRLIESSIEKGGVEARYLRLVVQLEAPEFLGYTENIEGDTQFIVSHLELSDVPTEIKNKIVNTLQKKGYVGADGK